jgi:hypothetical protein
MYGALHLGGVPIGERCGRQSKEAPLPGWKDPALLLQEPGLDGTFEVKGGGGRQAAGGRRPGIGRLCPTTEPERITVVLVRCGVEGRLWSTTEAERIVIVLVRCGVEGRLWSTTKAERIVVVLVRCGVEGGIAAHPAETVGSDRKSSPTLVAK